MQNAPWVAIHNPESRVPGETFASKKKGKIFSGGVPLRIFSSVMKVRVGKVGE